MAPKLKSAPKIAAVALAAAAIGTVAVPSASAAGGPSYFGVKTVYSETPSIFGFRGYFGGGIEGTNPGGGITDPGDGNDPGDGSTPGDGTDPSDGGTGGGDLPYPAECTASNKISSWFMDVGTTDGRLYLIPTSDADYSSSNPNAYSKWMDEARDQGATITVGSPKSSFDQLSVEYYNPSTGESSYDTRYNVDFSEFDSSAGTGQAVPAGTIDATKFPSYYNASKRQAANYGAIELTGLDTNPVRDLMNTPEFYEKVGATYSTSSDPKAPYYSLYPRALNVSYPVKVDWPAGSQYSKCSATTEATYSVRLDAS